jgi:hypothetical protein
LPLSLIGTPLEVLLAARPVKVVRDGLGERQLPDVADNQAEREERAGQDDDQGDRPVSSR